ncbi:MAG: hypothetical protein MAG431_00481 [Chloroflexi bacterium]|nr:hypothetical protein [Chloroflexota bacterium]
MPTGYKGELDSGIQSLVITLYYAVETTELKIVEFLEKFDILTSK